MTELQGGGVQWKNAEVSFITTDPSKLSLRVPAYVDERAAELVKAELVSNLLGELKGVVVEVEPGHPGSIYISPLDDPLPNPDFLSKVVRDAIDAAYQQALAFDEAAGDYQRLLRSLENSFPPSIGESH